MSLLLFYSCSATRKDIIWQNNTESLKTINVANLYGSMAPVQVFCSLLDNVVLDLLCPPSPLPPFPRLSLLAVLCTTLRDLSSPSIGTLFKIGTNKLWGSPGSQGLSLCLSVQVPSAALTYKDFMVLCVRGWRWGWTLWEGKWLQTATKTTLSLRCPSMTETHLRELIIWPVDVCCMCMCAKPCGRCVRNDKASFDRDDPNLLCSVSQCVRFAWMYTTELCVCVCVYVPSDGEGG